VDQATLLAGSATTDERTRLIHAFALVASKYGYEATTIGQVTEFAGTDKNTFHRHFDDLEDCFVAAYERISHILLTQMQAAFRTSPTWRDGLRAMLRTALTSLSAEPGYARMALVEAPAAGRRMRQARLRVTARYRDALAAHCLPRLPRDVQDAFVNGVYRMIALYVETGRTSELPDLLPELTYFALLPTTDQVDAATELT
jgi:AcrR family transcriptional regulator